jgi:hypothetical protein
MSGLLGDLLHPVEEGLLAAPEGIRRRVAGASASAAVVAASTSVDSSASISSGVHPARSSSASGGRVKSVSGSTLAFAVTAAPPFSLCRSTVARWTFKLRAKASMEERRRCWRPTTRRPAAA